MFRFSGEWAWVYAVIAVLTAAGGAVAFVWRIIRDLSKSRWEKERESREAFREDFIAFRDSANDEIDRLRKEIIYLRDELKKALAENDKLLEELANMKKRLGEVEKNTNAFSIELSDYKNKHEKDSDGDTS